MGISLRPTADCFITPGCSVNQATPRKFVLQPSRKEDVQNEVCLFVCNHFAFTPEGRCPTKLP